MQLRGRFVFRGGALVLGRGQGKENVAFSGLSLSCDNVCAILCAHSVAGVVESVDTTDLKSVAD